MDRIWSFLRLPGAEWSGEGGRPHIPQ